MAEETDIIVLKSVPSSIGRLTAKIYGEQPMYQFDISSTIINNYLPCSLHSFAAGSSLKKQIQRDFVFSAPVISAVWSQLSDNFEYLYSFVSMSDFFSQLLSNKDSLIRYNFVILNDCFVLTRVPHTHQLSYVLLGKHFTLAAQSTDVRFAGELWRDEQNNFCFNNNSGTYAPPKELINKVMELFNELVPSLQFIGMSFEDSKRPGLKRRLALKLKRKTTHLLHLY